MVLVVWGCGSKNGKHKGLGYFRIPKIITDQSKKYEELTRKRREKVDQWSKSWRHNLQRRISTRQKEFAVVIFTKDSQRRTSISSIQTGYLP